MTTKPDFITRRDRSFINEEGSAFLTRYNEMVAQKRQLEACEVGAIIAQVFLKHSWLQSFGIQMNSTVVYDRGAAEHTNECFIEVLEPVAAPHAAVPLEILRDCEFDEYKAEKAIKDELIDGSHVLHETLLGLNQEASERFYFDRNKILGLAGPDGEIKGSTAFAALFDGTSAQDLIQPEWASTAGGQAQEASPSPSRPRMR